MAPTRMIVPVTDRLKEELAATGRVLASLLSQDEEHARGGTNDRDNYAEVVGTLEPLVLAVLGTTSSVPLTARNLPAGARFDLGDGTPLSRNVGAAVAYLRDEASELLMTGNFSRSSGTNTEAALARLKQLHGLLLAGIVAQAELDMREIKRKGAVPLIAAATRLAQLAKMTAADATAKATANDMPA